MSTQLLNKPVGLVVEEKTVYLHGKIERHPVMQVTREKAKVVVVPCRYLIRSCCLFDYFGAVGLME